MKIRQTMPEESYNSHESMNEEVKSDLSNSFNQVRRIKTRPQGYLTFNLGLLHYYLQTAPRIGFVVFGGDFTQIW